MASRVNPQALYARSCAVAFEASEMGPIVEALRFALHQDKTETERWIEFACRNKVLAILFANLIRSKPALQDEPNFSYVSSMVGELYRQDIQHRAKLQNELRQFARQHALNDFIAIKGLAIQGEYPRPYQRHLRDLDLFCATPEGAYRLADDLQKHGYEIGADEPPWIKHLDPQLQACTSFASPFIGQINLVRIAHDFVCRFDIHFTQYSISYTPILAAELQRRAVIIQWGDISLAVPSNEDRLLILAAHILSQGVVWIKDLNDVAVLLRRPLDWEYIEAQARWAGIEAILAELLFRSQALTPGYASQKPNRGQLFRKILPSYRLGWLRRAMVNAYCTYVFERRHFSKRDALRNSFKCLGYYILHYQPKVSNRHVSWLSQRPPLPASLESLKRNECLRLIPPTLLSTDLPQASTSLRQQVEDQVWISQMGHANAYYLRSKEKPDVATFTLNGQNLLPTLTYQFHHQTLKDIANLFEWQPV